MARKIECDRCKRSRPGKYYAVSLGVAEHPDKLEDGVEHRDDVTIEDCCEHCLKTITKCVTLKKKQRRAKPKGNANPRKREARKTARSGRDEKALARLKAEADRLESKQSALPTPNGAPAKPSVPPPPEA